MRWFGLAIRPRLNSASAPSSLQKEIVVFGHRLVTLSLTIDENIKTALIAAHLNAGVSIIGIQSPSSPTAIRPSLISRMFSVDVKHHERRRLKNICKYDFGNYVSCFQHHY